MHNHQLLLTIKTLSGDMSDSSIASVISSIDIESIEDHHTRVIARTIKNSIDSLREHLDCTESFFQNVI